MNDKIQTIVLGLIESPPFDKRFDMAKRCYSVKGIAPAIYCYEGGGLQPKILIEYDWPCIDEAGYMLTYIEKVENGDTEFTIEIYSEDACGVLFATDGISYDSEKLKAALLFCGLDELANEIKS